MSDEKATTLSEDDAFDILSSDRRRFVIQRLHEASGPVELNDLAMSLAAEENGVPTDELTAKERKRMYVSLYQTHVPKLAEADAVTYDQEAGTVSPTPRTSDLVAYLHDSSERRTWALVYGAFGVVGVFVYLLLTAVQASSIVGVYVGITLFAFLTLLSLFHHRYVTGPAAKSET